ncbi:MAG: DUF2834 domain-containing protein [Vicinamibacterales bacterium]
MTPKALYAVLAFFGAFVPMTRLVPWVATHGPDATLMMRELFANDISAFFGLDVLVSAIVLIAFIRIDGRRFCMAHHWVPIVATLVVGVSFGLPLFLAMREHARERVRA